MQRFYAILSGLLVYTVFKAQQLLPHSFGLALLLSLGLFALMLGGTFLYRSQVDVFASPWFRVLAWSSSLLMGAWATFVLLSLPFDLVNLLLSLVALAGGPVFLFPWIFYVGLFSLSLLLVAVGFFEVWRGPRVREVVVSLPNLPPALEGLRIAQLSDLHVGATIRRRYVEEVVKRTNGAAPDLIVLTGDMADADPASIVGDLAPLADLRAGHGIFYVTGNHEYYWGADALVKRFAALGARPLLNAHQVFRVGTATVMVAGIPDPVGAQLGQAPDLRAAANGVADLKILLSHRPDPYAEAEAAGFHLQFSGHTHAGQFFPFSLFIGLAHRYSRGLYRHGRLWIYVNPGTGYWGPANRLGIPPEITLARLVSSGPTVG